MSICSAHQEVEPGCLACAATPADLFGKESWARAEAEAKRLGQVRCRCGFDFYATTTTCPLCNTFSIRAWFRQLMR